MKFHSDGKFRILQVSDAQDMHYVRRAMPYMLSRAYTSLRPDLIVFTGDNILGNHLADRRFGSGKKNLSKEREFANMKKALAYILDEPQRRGIPFAMIFGNHDDMNRFSKEEQLEIYRSYSCFCESVGYPVGNGEIPIYDASGEKRKFTLWFFDSSRYDDGNKRGDMSVLKEAVSFFTNRSEEIRALCASHIPGIAFVHIPLPAVLGLLREDENGTAEHKGIKYSIDPSKGVGQLNEYPSVMQSDSGLFKAMTADKCVKAVAFGHDHRNNFVGQIDGIDFLQTSCASFRCYGSKELRGVRVIDLELDSPKKYSSFFLSYEDLCGGDKFSDLRYFLNADEYEEPKNAALAGLSVLAASAAAAAALSFFKKKK